jgi:hypothetical protein
MTRPRIGLAVAAALIVGSCSGQTDPTGDSRPASASSAVAGPVAADLDRVAGDEGALEQAGVQVTETAADLVAIESPMVLTRVQADRLLADVDPANGVLGSTLDELAPLPPDVPSMSFLLAGWLVTARTPAAETARTWMGDQDWTRAPEIGFPEAVIVLFVNDIASSVDAATPSADGSIQFDLDGVLPPGPDPMSTVEPSGFAPRALPASASAGVGGPCTVVENLIGTALAAVVNALHVQPVRGGGVFGNIANVFIDVYNAAVELAAGTIRVAFRQLTEPVFDVIRIGIATLGVATQVTSFFRDTKLSLTLGPPNPYRFAIGLEEDQVGQVVARADSLTGRWPDELVECAQVTGVALPAPVGAGAATTWTAEQAPTVVALAAATTPVGDDLQARGDFTTGRESEEDAKGDQTNSAAKIRARIPRKDVDDLLRLGRQQIVSARALLIGRIPIAPLRSAAADALAAVVDPVVARLDAELTGAAAGVFGLSGQRLIFVDYHVPPTRPTTPATPPSSTGPAVDFCQRFRDILDYAENSDDPVVPWANEVADRLVALRPYAPTDLVDDIDVMVRVYLAVAASNDILTLIDTTEPLPAAAAAIGAHCGIGQREE